MIINVYLNFSKVVNQFLRFFSSNLCGLRLIQGSLVCMLILNVVPTESLGALVEEHKKEEKTITLKSPRLAANKC